MNPYISILLPMRNEEDYLARCLDSILANDYPGDRMEILVLDGMSTDRSRAIAEAYARCTPHIRVLDNPKRIVPTALNMGIAHAKGDVIMVMNAHTLYPHNYISGLAAWLERGHADNVGGIWITRPANDTPVAQAIAIALSHSFGVGNAHFRIGTSKPRWVDTVPFGCYRREVFDRIGFFDEELIRNQDEEFNFRLALRGGRILLVPQIASFYYARGSPLQLWRMGYQYGYFKPLVARKVGKVMTFRQIIPPLFVLALLSSALFAPWSWVARLALAMIVIAYAAADIGCSVSTAVARGAKCWIALCGMFPIMHLSYGVGFLRGVLDFLILRRTGAQDILSFPITR